MALIQDTKYNHLLDASALRCPAPILATKKRIGQIKPGEILLVKTTDPSFKIDLAAFIKITRNELIKGWQGKDFYFSLIRKK